MSDTSPLENVALMNQLPASDEPRGESPLYHADFKSMAAGGVDGAGVIIEEQALFGHLLIRGNAEDSQFAKAFDQVLGLALPGRLSSTESESLTLCWLAPDEWLLLCPGAEAFAIEQKLRQALSGHVSIVNVSGGQTLLCLQGDKIGELLMKSTSYDIHDRNFAVGKVVTTVFAKSQAIIRRTGENHWQLVIRRSFADYIWLWLQDAAAEYGLAIRV